MGRRLEGTRFDSYSHEGEDMVLRRILGPRPRGFYVDVGAFDPIRFSNSLFFYELGWRGLNVEPNPEAAARFRRLRPRDVNLTLAIANEPATLTYHMFNEPALNTFDPEMASRWQKMEQYRVERTLQVEPRRLADVLDRYLPRDCSIDFLSVDVEGLDYDVLCSNDWRRYRPECVVVEALEVPFDEVTRTATHALLEGVGYELVAKTLNSLVYRETRGPGGARDQSGIGVPRSEEGFA